MDLRSSVNKKGTLPTCHQFTYWPVLGTYKNWNIINLKPKSIPSEAFDKIHQVVLDIISESMASLVQLDMYGAINTNDTTTNGLYVIQFLSYAYTLQSNTKIDGQVISDGELVVKAQYLCSMQEKNNWYWKQQPLEYTIIVPTCTILHSRLEVIIIIHVKEIPRKLCGRIKAKKETQRHPNIVTDAYYNYIIDGIERHEKLSLKGM